MVSTKQLFINHQEVDIDARTVIALVDNSQPFTNLFSVKASRSNNFKLPATKRNKQIFENLELPQSGTMKRFEKFAVVYIQDGIEVISGGIGRVNKASNDGYELVVTGGNADLYTGVQLNTDGTEKTLNDLDFSDLDFIFSHANKTDIFKTQLADRNTRAFFLPLIDYEKDQIAPVLQRNLNFETIQGVTSWLQTFLAYPPPRLLINYRSSTRYLYPAVKVSEIVQRIIEQNGYNLTIPDNLRTKWAVIPFTNEAIKLKSDFVENRTVTLELTTDITITHGSSSTSIISFNDITDPATVYNNTTGYHMKAISPATERLCLTLQVDIEFMYYFKEQGSQPHKLKIGWRDNDSPFGIDYVQEYDLEETFITAVDDVTATDFDYQGSPKLIKASLDLDNFAYNFKDLNVFDRRLIIRVEFHGTLIISASKTKITIKPKATTKIMRGAVWGIAENLPPIKQSDFLKGFLQLNGLEIKQDEQTNNIVFEPIKDTLTSGLDDALDLSKKLDITKGYDLKTIGNTFAQNNVFEYKNDNTVTEENGFTVTASGVETGAKNTKIFTLPFAPTDDVLPSKGMGLYDFSDAIINAYLPMCNFDGFIQNRLEPRILLLNFFEGYGDPNKGDENGLAYEPPLFQNASLPQETDPEDPNVRPYGTLVDDLVTATFTNVNTIKYQFPEEDIKTLKIQNIVETEYQEYSEILQTTYVYEAFFAITPEDYRKLQKNRIIKIEKGELEGFWYVNKIDNYVDKSRSVKLELQKL